MKLNTKKITKKAFLAVALYSLLTYLFAHFAYMNIGTNAGVVFEMISLYVSKITDFIMPVTVAVLVLVLYASSGIKSAILSSFAISVGRVFFTLPFYYIVFIFNYGCDSVESLILASIASIGTIVFTVLIAFVSLWIALIIMRRSEGDAEASVLESLSGGQSKGDFSHGAHRAILIFAVIQLISNLIPEIYDTVTFFLERGLDYTIAEIATIMANFLLIFALVVVGYILGVWIKNLSLKEIIQENE